VIPSIFGGSEQAIYGKLGTIKGPKLALRLSGFASNTFERISLWVRRGEKWPVFNPKLLKTGLRWGRKRCCY
jgi:hypothetical protein